MPSEGLDIDATKILATFDLNLKNVSNALITKAVKSEDSVESKSKVFLSGDGYGSGYDTDFDENVAPQYPELDDLFLLHNTIGHGGFSKVKVATDLFTGNKVAIKIVDKEHVGSELPRIDLEVETLQPLRHPHICKLFSVIGAKTKIFMIMEYCPTDLYEHIVNQDKLIPMEEARRIFIQLMSAVAYLHSNGIVHRDLKPENVLLDRNLNVKLTDFGLCAVPGKTRINKPTLKTLCGSPAYCAPELLRGPPYIGSKVDVWSLGVMLYVLLAKELPFYSKNVKELYKKIQDGHYQIPEWIPDSAKDLIDAMLQPSVNLRPCLHRLWSHPWIAAGDLTPFKEQIGVSADMEFRIQSRYTCLPNNIGRRASSFTGFDDNLGHGFIVPYIETSGGDACSLIPMPMPRFGRRKQSALGKSQTLSQTRIETGIQNQQPQASPASGKRKLWAVIHTILESYTQPQEDWNAYNFGYVRFAKQRVTTAIQIEDTCNFFATFFKN